MITKEEVEHLAKLARIELLDAEADSLASEIDSILGYVEKIQSSSATERERGNTEPSTANVRNVIREDIPTNTSGQYTEKLLSNAPKREGNYLKVKKIL